jgi:spore coat polysaccharide biosynthesis protein SpsF
MLKRRVVAIIQARMGSTRLPGKVIEKIGDKPLLEILVNRLQKSEYVDDITIATTKKEKDNAVEILANEIGINCYRGSEEDVLERFAEASMISNADVVVRVTGDNPLIDTDLVDTLINVHLTNNLDYTYCLDTPLGVSAEIIESKVLEDISKKAELESEREHVTPYIRSHQDDYKILQYYSKIRNQNIRLTVDTDEDLKLVKTIYQHLGDLENLKISAVINFLKANPDIYRINAGVEQNPEDTIKTIRTAFLTEGSSEMGMGHVYRSITFARTILANLMGKAYFLTKSNDSVIKLIEDENLPAFKLKNDEEIVEHLKKLDINLVVIDNLDFNEEILKKIKDTVNARVVMVDNLTPKIDRYADIVMSLVRSNFSNKHIYNSNIDTMYLCGPKYLILRDEFDVFKNKKDLKPKIEDILLIFGGSDPSNHTSNVLEKLSDDIRVNIVLGPEFKYFDDLDRILMKKQKSNVIVHREPENVAELMYNADLVITSPGLSMFESVYVGTPVLVISQNSLQKRYYSPLNYEYLIDKSDINNLENYLKELSFLDKRNEVITYFKGLEVGQGKGEIIDYLSEMILDED